MELGLAAVERVDHCGVDHGRRDSTDQRAFSRCDQSQAAHHAGLDDD